MPDPFDEFRLEWLGRSERAALDQLLREFRRRGWRDDDDAAGAIISALARRGGSASRRTVLSAVPRDFLVRNAIRRVDVARMLDLLSMAASR
jgi:hypothetical protein